MPSRRSGSWSTILSVPGDRIAVSISPGEMALTRMPRGPEIGRHLAGQSRQRRLGGGVGRTREGVDPGAGDRGHVDHRTVRVLQFLDQPTGQHHGREKIHLEDGFPIGDRRVDGSQPHAALGLRRNARIVDERVEPALGKALPHFADGRFDIVRVREVELEMIFRSHLPRAVLGKGMARAGDDTPARRGKSLHGRVADAPRGAGQQHGARGRA